MNVQRTDVLKQQLQTNGRLSLAFALTADSILFSWVLLTLCLSEFDGFDMFLLALHFSHIFTITLACLAVYRSTAAVDVLRMLFIFYMIAGLMDCCACIARFVLIIHLRDVASFVRLLIAIGLILVDALGGVFAESSRATAHLLSIRSDERLQAAAYYSKLEQSKQQQQQQLPV